MPKGTRITTHNRIQGWPDVRIQGWPDAGPWGGVSVAHIMRLRRPQPHARYVVVQAVDDKVRLAPCDRTG